MNLSSLGTEVQDRLEEAEGSPGVFWNLATEIYPLLVEAMAAATLMTGEPQGMIGTGGYTVVHNSNKQAMPSGAVAILRVEVPGQGQLMKTSVYDLDRFSPGWEGVSGAALKYWFPIGLTQFGVYPQMAADTGVNVAYVQVPVTLASAYTGSETVPFQAEYAYGFVEVAAAMARLKEGGAELMGGLVELDAFVDKLAQLGSYGWRRGSTRFTRAMGVQADITDVTKRG